jgi:palmitoyl-protein thioesterase
MLQIDHLIAK